MLGCATACPVVSDRVSVINVNACAVKVSAVVLKHYEV